MIDQEHSKLVQETCKSGEVILDTLDGLKVHLIHMILGLCGEAGELLDTVKKNAIYQKELDIDNIVEELGDALYYIRGIELALGIDREDVLKHNIDKLRRRYGSQYSDASAINRKDKKYPHVIGSTHPAMKSPHPEGYESNQRDGQAWSELANQVVGAEWSDKHIDPN